MNQPVPQGMSFSNLIGDIERGNIKIPRFQRDFVWTKDKSAQLIDSILKGYPIGTFIIWKTKESLRAVRNLGKVELPETPPGDFVHYVLDGQQRLTSLYSSIKGLEIERDERKEDFSEMYVDLNAEEDEQIVTVDISEKDPTSVLKVVDLLEAKINTLRQYPEEFQDAIDEYRDRLKTYTFSVVSVSEAPIDVATEIFTRINVTGKPLSTFEIMVAKTFEPDWIDPESGELGFDLGQKYEEIIDDLIDIKYETVPAIVVLQAVSAILTKECAKKDILKLNKQKFIDVWPDAVEAIYSAVDYFRSFYRIPVSKLLPYNALLVPFSYFFYHHPNKPSGDKQKYLQDFFWRSSLGARYSFASESKLAQDLDRIDSILDDQLPTYDYPVDTSASFIRDNGWFSASRSYVKAILCPMVYQQPKSFIDDSLVHVSNDWLKQANSKNYHHFFPKAYLPKVGYKDWEANHVANITIVDDFLNKRKIRDKPPKIYMTEFKESNPDIAETMRSHLINIDGFGIWENDYEEFIDARCQAISVELNKRVIHQAVDERSQSIHTDDVEDIETEAASV